MRSRCELQGSDSNRPVQAYEACSGPALPARNDVVGEFVSLDVYKTGNPTTAVHFVAGGRGIEPRWSVLETNLIPDRYPGAARSV